MILMWILAFSIYAFCKLASFLIVKKSTLTKNLLYLFCWPGMDAHTFLHSNNAIKPRMEEIFPAAFNTGLGLNLIQLNIPILTIIGIVLTLHFGIFYFLSIMFRMFNIDAKPIMNWPIFANSVTDFWSNRWNLAFRDLAYNFIFKPLRKNPLATFTVFLVSGLIHDIVMSIPTNSFGNATTYFLIQFCGITIEKHFKLKNRLFAFAIILIPLPLLITPKFIELFK